jgi:hypothetical protein
MGSWIIMSSNKILIRIQRSKVIVVVTQEDFQLEKIICIKILVFNKWV